MFTTALILGDAAGNCGRPADDWATLDLDWWEKEGYPANLNTIREFPWHQLQGRMQDSMPNLNAGAMVSVRWNDLQNPWVRLSSGHGFEDHLSRPQVGIII